METSIEELQQILYEAATEAVEQIVEDAKEKLSEAYPPASTPGEFPHMRSGNLLESVNGQVTVTETGVEIEVGSPLIYSLYLEEGTETMEPRPVWSPLAETWQQRLPEILGGVIEQHFQ